jgi:hypothetical protein
VRLASQNAATPPQRRARQGGLSDRRPMAPALNADMRNRVRSAPAGGRPRRGRARRGGIRAARERQSPYGGPSGQGGSGRSGGRWPFDPLETRPTTEIPGVISDRPAHASPPHSHPLRAVVGTLVLPKCRAFFNATRSRHDLVNTRNCWFLFMVTDTQSDSLLNAEQRRAAACN